jgi:hypothetical protein
VLSNGPGPSREADVTGDARLASPLQQASALGGISVSKNWS